MTVRVPEGARHEVKFTAAPVRYRVLAQWLRLHSAGFTSPYPPRRVNNVYFDDYRLVAYHENLVGESARSKVRLRWYGETLHPDSGVLEVKRKRNLMGWKLSYATGAIDLEADSWRVIRGKLRAGLSPEARLWLDANPQAVLINRYEREYFVSRDGKVRVTLDARQRVFDQRFGERPNVTRPANLPDTVVVEFKFDRGDFSLGSRAIQGMPVRASRNSKYVIGVQSLLPG
ncbi:MAG: VTC domain-containing protein [Myxococcales bacterium]|nr:VTC domain-containing protein [Myxococcales bacterium]